MIILVFFTGACLFHNNNDECHNNYYDDIEKELRNPRNVKLLIDGKIHFLRTFPGPIPGEILALH